MTEPHAGFGGGDHGPRAKVILALLDDAHEKFRQLAGLQTFDPDADHRRPRRARKRQERMEVRVKRHNSTTVFSGVSKDGLIARGSQADIARVLRFQTQLEQMSGSGAGQALVKPQPHRVTTGGRILSSR